MKDAHRTEPIPYTVAINFCVSSATPTWTINALTGQVDFGKKHLSGNACRLKRSTQHPVPG
jgi:hypothetical protein